jgi:hypothetical protein
LKKWFSICLLTAMLLACSLGTYAAHNPPRRGPQPAPTPTPTPWPPDKPGEKDPHQPGGKPDNRPGNPNHPPDNKPGPPPKNDDRRDDHGRPDGKPGNGPQPDRRPGPPRHDDDDRWHDQPNHPDPHGPRFGDDDRHDRDRYDRHDRRPGPRPPRYGREPRSQAQANARSTIHRTAQVIADAQDAARYRHYKAGLAQAIAHQQYALQLYRRGSYWDAIYHSMRARSLAFRVIQNNQRSWRPEFDWDDDENDYLLEIPRDEDLDRNLIGIRIITDDAALFLRLNLDL